MIPLLLQRIYFTNKVRFFAFIITALFPLSCAVVQRPVPQEPFVIYEVERLILNIRDQQNKVSSFFASGSVLVKGWIGKSEADILIAGVKDPFKIKIEVTHPWGNPIFHFLIDSERVEALSFSEKKIYLGDLTPEALAGLLPETLCDRDLIWSVLRGFPLIERYHKAESSRKNEISLLNKEGGDVEIIRFYSESPLPEVVLYPEKSLELLFSEFKEKSGIYYAEEVTVNNIEGAKDLVLKLNKMFLNNHIPDEIFTLEKPQNFETVYLDEMSVDAYR
jgi:hypothetical protein